MIGWFKKFEGPQVSKPAFGLSGSSQRNPVLTSTPSEQQLINPEKNEQSLEHIEFHYDELDYFDPTVSRQIDLSSKVSNESGLLFKTKMDTSESSVSSTSRDPVQNTGISVHRLNLSTNKKPSTSTKGINRSNSIPKKRSFGDMNGTTQHGGPKISSYFSATRTPIIKSSSTTSSSSAKTTQEIVSDEDISDEVDVLFVDRIVDSCKASKPSPPKAQSMSAATKSVSISKRTNSISHYFAGNKLSDKAVNGGSHKHSMQEVINLYSDSDSADNTSQSSSCESVCKTMEVMVESNHTTQMDQVN